MTGYALVNLVNFLNELGEEKTKELLSEFSCPLNPDVEYFLKHKAIEFSKQRFAQTHLVYASYKGKYVLVGYFALANKYLTLTGDSLTSKLRGRLRYFATFDSRIRCYCLSAPLIAQLGKNFSNGYNDLITGDELLKLACDKVSKLQMEVGGCFAYIECEDKYKLTDFYSRNGFCQFDKRKLDKDETDKLSGDYLVQMLKYIHK